jgi:RpiB/LacA/LacB family sugar-phosphate isomerase
MKIALGSDHAGYDLKEDLEALVASLGHEVIDTGSHNREPADYPDSARAVAELVSARRAERGIVVCGSGVGASITANKVPGVRAAICHDTYSARQGVEHDDMNVLTLGARVVGSELARDIVRVFLAAQFSAEERHLRRLRKVIETEQTYFRLP